MNKLLVQLTEKMLRNYNSNTGPIFGGLTLGVDLRGECEEVVPINQLNQESDNLNVLSNIMMDKLDEMADSEDEFTTKEKRSSEHVDEYIIFDFYEDILQNQE